MFAEHVTHDICVTLCCLQSVRSACGTRGMCVAVTANLNHESSHLDHTYGPGGDCEVRGGLECLDTFCVGVSVSACAMTGMLSFRVEDVSRGVVWLFGSRQ